MFINCNACNYEMLSTNSNVKEPNKPLQKLTEGLYFSGKTLGDKHISLLGYNVSWVSNQKLLILLQYKLRYVEIE